MLLSRNSASFWCASVRSDALAKPGCSPSSFSTYFPSRCSYSPRSASGISEREERIAFMYSISTTDLYSVSSAMLKRRDSRADRGIDDLDPCAIEDFSRPDEALIPHLRLVLGPLKARIVEVASVTVVTEENDRVEAQPRSDLEREEPREGRVRSSRELEPTKRRRRAEVRELREPMDRRR